MTNWIGRLYFFVRVSDLTAGVRNGIADGFANNGSDQTRAHELNMFNTALRYSVSGNTPATVLAWNAPIKAAMRDELRTLVSALPQSAYYVVANTDVPGQGWLEGQLTHTDSNITIVGTTPFSFDAAFTDVNARRQAASLQPLIRIQESV